MLLADWSESCASFDDPEVRRESAAATRPATCAIALEP